MRREIADLVFCFKAIHGQIQIYLCGLLLVDALYEIPMISSWLFHLPVLVFLNIHILLELQDYEILCHIQFAP